MDMFDQTRRSEIMSSIRGRDTRPEMAVRRALHALGYRYRLHDSRLPGKPDMVFARYQAVIFVHGCFWHGHDCHLFRIPKTRTAFWTEKIVGNASRDQTITTRLLSDGWRVLTIWECSMRGKSALPFDDLLDGIEGWLHSETPAHVIRGMES